MAINYDIFEEIDTNEKAYWLGFLFADGYVDGKGLVRLILSVKDKNQIERYASFLGDENPNIKHYGPYKTAGEAVHYWSRSKKMTADLEKYGVVRAKSKIIRLPYFENDDILLAFMMGVFDGDGCQGTTSFCSGSKLFMEDVKERFNLENNIRNQNNVYHMCLGMDLFRKMMETYPTSIERKRKLNHILGNSKTHPKCPKCGNNMSRGASLCMDCYLEMSKPKRIKKPKYKGTKPKPKYKPGSKPKDQDPCPKCGNKKDKRAKVCCSCATKKRKFETTKEELDRLINIEKLSYVELGKRFGVSDNAVKKRARKLGVPLPVRQKAK